MSFALSDLWPTVRPASIPNGVVNLAYAATFGGIASRSLGFGVFDGVRVGVLGYGGVAAGTLAYDAVNYVGGDDEGSYAQPNSNLNNGPKPTPLKKDWVSELLNQTVKDAAKQPQRLSSDESLAGGERWQRKRIV